MILLLLLPFGFMNAQKIGELAPERPPEIFPNNSWGVDIMFSEGGFGLGTFYRKALTDDITGFIDFSISETKDEKEIQYIDYFGYTYTPDKVNRAFMLPVNVGMQFRLFSKSLTENFRPYITFGIGPTVFITTPYDKEFFSAFGSAKAHYAIGGYIGCGANMGLSKSNLIGLNVRYYYCRILGDRIELMTNSFKNEFGQIAITLNVGIMY